MRVYSHYKTLSRLALNTLAPLPYFHPRKILLDFWKFITLASLTLSQSNSFKKCPKCITFACLMKYLDIYAFFFLIEPIKKGAHEIKKNLTHFGHKNICSSIFLLCVSMGHWRFVIYISIIAITLLFCFFVLSISPSFQVHFLCVKWCGWPFLGVMESHIFWAYGSIGCCWVLMLCFLSQMKNGMFLWRGL